MRSYKRMMLLSQTKHLSWKPLPGNTTLGVRDRARLGQSSNQGENTSSAGRKMNTYENIVHGANPLSKSKRFKNSCGKQRSSSELALAESQPYQEKLIASVETIRGLETSKH